MFQPSHKLYISYLDRQKKFCSGYKDLPETHRKEQAYSLFTWENSEFCFLKEFAFRRKLTFSFYPKTI